MIFNMRCKMRNYVAFCNYSVNDFEPVVIRAAGKNDNNINGVAHAIQRETQIATVGTLLELREAACTETPRVTANVE